MQDNNDTGRGIEGGSSGRSGFLAGIRNRTEREQGTSSPLGGSTYSAASIGQAPYVALGNGVVIVQRRCSNDWNC